MIIKTRQGLADAVIAEVRQQHSYSNPALVVLPIVGGSADYLRWLGEETAPEDE
jgi:periplasmic divalent cation tolerance protein